MQKFEIHYDFKPKKINVFSKMTEIPEKMGDEIILHPDRTFLLYQKIF
jgi:hypothetical protein